MQLHAGYILDGMSQIERNEEITALAKHLSYFDVQTNTNFEPIEVDPLIAVANNIISRGLPTKPSTFIEGSFSEGFNYTKRKADEMGSVSFLFHTHNSDFEKLIFQAFHIIDPRITSSKQYEDFPESWEKLGSQYEKDFLFSIVPDYIGEQYLQLFEPQRSLESILRYSLEQHAELEKYLNGSIDIFHNQEVDFALELPYPINEKKGLIVEIDGSQHQKTAQKKLDDMRDDAAIKAGWDKTIRITTDDFQHINSAISPLKQFIDNEYFSIINNNFKTPLYNDKWGLDALQLALSPIAVARIQKVILQWLMAGEISLSDHTWNIAIIERDIPCAFLAIEDLKRVFKNLFLLEGRNKGLPDIELQVFNTQEFKDSKLNKKYQSKIKDISQLSNRTFDCLIDCSVLQRKGIKADDYSKYANKFAIIKSAHAPVSKRQFCTTELVRYGKILQTEETNLRTQEIDENYENEHAIEKRQQALETFLTDIFRKEKFRPGQRSILNRTLQLENVVGLLPTGGGKSLVYQLSVLLQPGISLIVDPIKSLMKDQFEGLERNLIDAAEVINSSKTAKQREIAMNKVVNAETLFAFISPERLQIKSFRDKLIKMSDELNNYFSYCIVDEAHCVSEWGHDFRTSYLRLGKNARVYCKSKGATKEKETDEFNPSVPIVGLTATASFDVLSDVQRELDISDDGVIRSQGMERPELNYKVISVPIEQRIINRARNEFEANQIVSEQKQFELIKLIKNLPKYDSEIEDKGHTDGTSLDDFFNDNNAGLVFCPHKSERINSGVKNIYPIITEKFPRLSVGTYMGSSEENEKERAEEDRISEVSQSKFLNNEINLLVATKAFGMGIDKPNIRFTVHFNYPSSIESFYQEAGRAGRDRRKSLCFILYGQHESEKEILNNFYNISFKGEFKEKSVIYEILSEITFPADNFSNELTDQLQNELGINAYFNFWPRENPRRLYLNEAFQRGYGYIDLNNLTIHPDGGTFEFAEANRVLTQLKSLIENDRPNNVNLITWLTKEIEPKPAPGIEKLLANTTIGAQLSPIVVGFRNDKIKRITELLKRNVNDNFTELIVKKASNFCFSGDDFITKLSKEFYNATRQGIEIQENIASKIKSLFPKIRDQQDTFKAVYRLSVIGVVDDYEVDYNSKTLTLYVSKKEDENYIRHLHQYLRRYLSEERAKKVFEKVYEYRGESIIQKCLGYLINFVYEEIAEKRKSAIDAMKNACDIGIGKNGENEFREYLDVYFNSKYYPHLVEKTEEGKEFSIDLVWNYIEETEGNIDNLKHLRGACARLLTENPENGALLLLKSFSLFLIDSDNTQMINEATQDAMKGFRIFKEDKEMNFENFHYCLNEFKAYILNYNGDLENRVHEITEILLLNHHKNWLQEFNNKYLLEYERTNT